MTKRYLQLTQPTGERSCWIGGQSKRSAKTTAKQFRKSGWRVRITSKPTKYNIASRCPVGIRRKR